MPVVGANLREKRKNRGRTQALNRMWGSVLKIRILMNREGTGKGVAWVKSNFSGNRASTIIDRAEEFLDNMNFRIIGKGWSSAVEKEDGEVILNENLSYQNSSFWLSFCHA